PRPPGDARVPLREGQPLRGTDVSSRPGADAAAAGGGEGGRAVRAGDVGGGTRRDRGGSSGCDPARRPPVDPPLLLRRHHGSGPGKLDGPALLPPDRREPAGPHHLLGGGNRGVEAYLRGPDGP